MSFHVDYMIEFRCTRIEFFLWKVTPPRRKLKETQEAKEHNCYSDLLFDPASLYLISHYRRLTSSRLVWFDICKLGVLNSVLFLLEELRKLQRAKEWSRASRALDASMFWSWEIWRLIWLTLFISILEARRLVIERHLVRFSSKNCL